MAQGNQSLAESLSLLSVEQQHEIIASLSDDELTALQYDWKFWARPDQLAPEGDWSVWLALAGRGWGKTRAGAEWVRDQVSNGRRRRIVLIGATAAAVRDIMVEGESGILAISPKWFYPKYEPSKTRITWPNGARAELFSADSPDALRGIQSEIIWADELAAWRYGQEAWDMAALGRRLGTKPQTMVTTTPRPTPLVKKLVADSLTHVTKGTTYDNLINMAPSFKHDILSKYEGTRLGRQELNAEILDDNPGALWQRLTIEINRLLVVPRLTRIVVGVDPEISSEEGSAETGIVVAGKAMVGNRSEYFVLDDASLRESPLKWASQAVAHYNKYKADRIIAEGNQGGEMVTQTIATVGVSTSIVKIVHASRSKQARAEPIAALYEQGRVHHIGAFPILEDQMCEWVPTSGDPSPDRLDALVWALTELSQGPELPMQWMKV